MRRSTWQPICTLVISYFQLVDIHSKSFVILLRRRSLKTGSLVRLGSMDEQVADTLRVAPLVVVPGDQLHEVLVERDTRLRVKDGRARLADEVSRDDILIGVAQNALDNELVKGKQSKADERERTLSSPSEAAFITALISSYGASFSVRTTKSTTDTSWVGTRKAIPVSLPFKLGMTFPTALAAPVEEGMMFPLTARPPLQSFIEGPSTVFCVAVVAWTVVIKASTIPNLSLMTFARGARQFVVQDAFEIFV